MNTEGYFYALSRYDVRGFLIEPASVDPYLQRTAIRGGPNARLELGNLWQAAMAVLPEINNGLAVQGTPAAHCWVWPADCVTEGVQHLGALEASAWAQRVQAWQAQHSDAQSVSAGNNEALLHQLAQLHQFFQAAAKRHDAVLLYVL